MNTPIPSFWQAGFGRFLRWTMFLPIGFLLLFLIEALPTFVLYFLPAGSNTMFVIACAATAILPFLLLLLAYMNTIHMAVDIICPRPKTGVVIFGIIYFLWSALIVITLLGHNGVTIFTAILLFIKALFVVAAGVALFESYKKAYAPQCRDDAMQNPKKDEVASSYLPMTPDYIKKRGVDIDGQEADIKHALSACEDGRFSECAECCERMIAAAGKDFVITVEGRQFSCYALLIEALAGKAGIAPITLATPLVRFGARMIDNILMGCVVLLVILLFDRSASIDNNASTAIAFISCFIWLFAETVLLASWGTTPGKWLVGVRVQQVSGGIMSYRAALARSVRVWLKGLGAGIPVVQLFTMPIAYANLKERKITSWDKAGRMIVLQENIRVWHTAGVVVVFLFVAFLGFLGLFTNDAREDITLFNKGCEYYGGTNGAPQDYTLAVKYFRKAAEQGLAEAQYNLGTCYANGIGVAKDEKLAVEWYRKAASQGNADAQCNLGVCYVKGIGIAKNEKLAVEWYSKAAEQGNVQAQEALKLRQQQ